MPRSKAPESRFWPKIAKRKVASLANATFVAVEERRLVSTRLGLLRVECEYRADARQNFLRYLAYKPDFTTQKLA